MSFMNSLVATTKQLLIASSTENRCSGYFNKIHLNISKLQKISITHWFDKPKLNEEIRPSLLTTVSFKLQ